MDEDEIKGGAIPTDDDDPKEEELDLEDELESDSLDVDPELLDGDIEV